MSLHFTAFAAPPSRLRASIAAVLLVAAGSSFAEMASAPMSSGWTSVAFKRVDANGDGRISREEAAALPTVLERFRTLDRDKDGFLSIDEFNLGLSAEPLPVEFQGSSTPD